jgi:hypothetical protein
MTEPETQSVKVTAEDIASLSPKLQEFAQQLSPGEQNVVAWLLGRAAQAPMDADLPTKEGGGEPAAPGDEPVAFNEILNNSLGIPQFERFRPGEEFAGSGVAVTSSINPTGPTTGVTAGIMF